jgi:hypothetical protein
VIIAFANGVTIQSRVSPNTKWLDTPNPAWDVEYEYRVKPAEKVMYVNMYPRIHISSDHREYVSTHAYAELAHALHGSTDDNGKHHRNTIKAVFDPKTEEIISIELIR